MAAMSLLRAPLLTGICVDNTPTNAVKKIFITCRNSTPHRFPWEIQRMKNPAQQPMPTARKEGLLVRELDDEVLVYDLHSHKAHCLNTTAARVWRRCDGRTRISEITQAIQGASGGSLDDEVVWFAIEQLERANLIDAATVRKSTSPRLSRRELIKKAGIAAAIALPLVTTIMAPRAVEAATCLPPNAACTSNSQCCNGTCIGAPTGTCN